MQCKEILLALSFLCTSISFASDSCESVDSELQHMECLSKNYEMSEHKLSAYHRGLENDVLSYYKADLSLGKSLVDTMKSSQVLWMKYRDKQCEVQLFEIEKESPTYETSMQACIVDFNKERISQLESFRNNFN